MTARMQVSGNLTMISINGDGLQLLTEAAEFVEALARMGVTMDVEINLRPTAGDTEAPTGWPVNHAQGKASAPTTDVQVEERVEIGAGMVVDPTTAAPTPADEPRTWNLEPKARKASGEKRNSDSQAAQKGWRRLPQDERRRRFEAVVRNLTDTLGGPPTQAEYNESKPDNLPTATAIVTSLYDVSWKEIVSRSATRMDLSSGESA